MGEKMNEIVMSLLDTVLGTAAGDLTRKDCESWDSLAHMEIVATLEKRFGVSFTLREVMGIDSVDNIVNLLHEKGVAL